VAFPASPDPLARALTSAQDTARGLKQQAQDVRAACAAGPVSAVVLLELYQRLTDAKARFQATQQVPGILQYARDEFANPALDVLAEFTAMTTATMNAAAWVTANFPASGGFILAAQLTATGVSYRQFTSLQTAGLLPVLDALTATIA
jgi:hypothetical protein